MTTLSTVVIPGPPRTKKNHSRLVWNGQRPRILPSKAYEDWEAVALAKCKIQGAKYIGVPVNCRANIYRDKATGDAVGYYQALADFLQKACVVLDDKWIVSWDGTRMSKDADNPRVELTLEAAQ